MYNIININIRINNINISSVGLTLTNLSLLLISLLRISLSALFVTILLYKSYSILINNCFIFFFWQDSIGVLAIKTYNEFWLKGYRIKRSLNWEAFPTTQTSKSLRNICAKRCPYFLLLSSSYSQMLVLGRPLE